MLTKKKKKGLSLKMKNDFFFYLLFVCLDFFWDLSHKGNKLLMK